MSPWVIAMLVTVFVVIDLAVVGGVLAACATPLRGLQERFPPIEPGPGAVTKRFQSWSVELANWGNCVHVTCDADYLHLRGAWVLRVMGFQGCSVPWAQVSAPEPTWRRGYRVSTIAGVRVRGPAWCLDLASPAGGAGERGAGGAQ
jgi:hypothetical protein